MVTLQDIHDARARLGSRLHRTPVLTATTLGAMAGVELLVKAELLQRTGSFKPRGVLTKLARLTSEERARGVIGISAGNHAQALAYGAAREGIACAVVVPVGGGGLICGIATALKEQRPDVRVVGVEPDGAPSLTRALDAGRVVPLPSVQTIADGLAAPFAGPLTLETAQRYVDDVVLVSDDEIVEALRLTLERTKLQVEPAGAAGVAALLAGRCGVRPGARVVAMLSGGNVDRARLKEIL